MMIDRKSMWIVFCRQHVHFFARQNGDIHYIDCIDYNIDYIDYIDSIDY